MENKLILFAVIFSMLAASVITISTFPGASASVVSNESIQAKENIAKAEVCLDEMISKNISVVRANESYVSGVQLYDAKQSYVVKGISDYTKINEYLIEVCTIRDDALKASDELKVFIDSYNEISQTTNLSEFDGTYNKIIASFNGERFEETISLIDDGYKEMLDIQARQSALNVFYKEQARTLKNFVIGNWKYILIIVVVTLVVLNASWRAIRRTILKRKMNNLFAQREALNSLIKEIQKKYFEQGKISEFEFETKLKRYKEMMLDVERQIPLVKEEMVRVEKLKPSKDNVIKDREKTESVTKVRTILRRKKLRISRTKRHIGRKVSKNKKFK
ncbi:hypothetical protein J4229_00020 [Candidatus Pacearchaeota archaeon]|nr:hypothetical protein [Candidatus Pacearchaeota archaeon]